jgi:hypothetical protein
VKLKEVADLLEAQFLNLEGEGEREIEAACAADLLSDVLALRGGPALTVTSNVAPQVVRVAEVMGIPAILYVRGKKPSEEKVITWATENRIVLLSTPIPTFEACGRLYLKGIRCSEGKYL